MPYEKTLIDKLVLGISSALGDISKWKGNEEDAKEFLKEIGIDLDLDVDGSISIPTEFDGLSEAVGYYEDVVKSETAEESEVYNKFTTMATELAKTISEIPTLYDNISERIRAIDDDATIISDEFAKRFIDYALVNYCRNSYPAIYGILLVVGVIDKTDNITKFHFDRLLQIFKNPSNLINDVYYNGDDLRLEKIITNVISIALSFNKSE